MIKNLFKVSALILGLGLAQAAMATTTGSVTIFDADSNALADSGKFAPGSPSSFSITSSLMDQESFTVDVKGKGTFAYNTLFTVGQLSDASATITSAAGFTEELYHQNGSSWDKLNTEPAVAVGYKDYTHLVIGDTYKLFTSGTVSAGHAFSTSLSVISAVPEAEEWAMMMLGLGMIGFVANRKKASNTNPFVAVAA